MDRRLDALDGRLEIVSRRLDTVESDVSSIRPDPSDIRAELKILKWSVGATLGGIIAVLVRTFFP